MKRTCFTCKVSNICFAFDSLHDVAKKLPVNIDGDAAPGKITDVYNSLANCCLKYDPIQQSNN